MQRVTCSGHTRIYHGSHVDLAWIKCGSSTDIKRIYMAIVYVDYFINNPADFGRSTTSSGTCRASSETMPDMNDCRRVSRSLIIKL